MTLLLFHVGCVFQGFMTGALQTYARKTKIPIDTLTFQTVVMDKHEAELTVGPENGVYVYGLYLQGARWDIPVRAACAGYRRCAVFVLWWRYLHKERGGSDGHTGR